MKEELSIEDDEYEEDDADEEDEEEDTEEGTVIEAQLRNICNSCSTPVARRWTSMWPFT